MSDFLLDSGILIRHLRDYAGYPKLLDALADTGSLFISTITRFEVLQGMKERERQQTFNTLMALESLPVSSEVADTAGDFVRSWRGRGLIFGIADALIAATAFQHNLPLLTTNPKHFPMPELTILRADEAGNITS